MKMIKLFQSSKFKNKKVLSVLISNFLGWSKDDIIKNLDVDIPEFIVKNIEKAYIEWYEKKNLWSILYDM